MMVNYKLYFKTLLMYMQEKRNNRTIIMIGIKCLTGAIKKGEEKGRNSDRQAKNLSYIR